MEPKPNRFKKKKPPGFKKPSKPMQKMPALQRWQKPEGSEQYSELLSKLVGRELECMVCMNQIGWRGKIWNCDQCRIPEHLTCIKKWTESSGKHWNCPACNYEYDTEPKYTCFCGKVNDPAPHPMHPPHSCGDVCGRNRGTDCPHLCPQQCHPGACPPCTSMAPPQKCYCGHTSYQPLCKDKHLGRACENPCQKALNCGNHFCQALCHDEKCKPCLVRTTTDCYCGKEVLDLPCGAEPVCGNKCNKILKCGKHFCEKICHAGPCGECLLSPSLITHCPCGKNALDMILLYPRLSCCDPIPSCYGVCNKVLVCGHKCSAVCHTGPCPSCKSVQTVSCRCTRTSQEVNCKDLGQVFLCNKLCKAKKSCKRHKCNTYCCLGYDDPFSVEHRCLETCGKLLNCGIHTCLGHCHIGNCEPCKVIVRNRISCACGKSFKDPPLKCGTVDMEVPCSFKCEKELKCTHKCQSTCHHGDCPPCCQLVEKSCKCGKMDLPVSCGIVSVSCGKICMKPLECAHKCTEKCHSGPCSAFVKSHLCGKLKEKCEHKCSITCHYPEPCPEEECKVKVLGHCKCGNRSVTRLCAETSEIECDDNCLKAQRDKAFGTISKESYSEELVEFAKNNMDFTKKVEAKFQSIMNSKEKFNSLPPMKDQQRWFCHEMANHYNLDCESLDREPYRSVVIYVNEKSRIPSPLLSSFVALVNQGIEVEFEKKEPVASILFYQLSASVTTDDLVDVLQHFSGDFFIKWENDHSAYAHFFSLHKCSEAKKQLERKPGQYSVNKMITNLAVEDTSGFKKKYKNARKAQEVKNFDEVEEKPKIVNISNKIEKNEKIVEEKKVSLFAQLRDEEDN